MELVDFEKDEKVSRSGRPPARRALVPYKES